MPFEGAWALTEDQKLHMECIEMLPDQEIPGMKWGEIVEV